MDERVQRKQRALIDRWRTILSLRHFSHLSGLCHCLWKSFSARDERQIQCLCLCVSVRQRKSSRLTFLEHSAVHINVHLSVDTKTLVLDNPEHLTHSAPTPSVTINQKHAGDWVSLLSVWPALWLALSGRSALVTSDFPHWERMDRPFSACHRVISQRTWL